MEKSKKTKKVIFGLDKKAAGALCYVGIWASGLVFLLAEKDDSYVRFHAMQSLMFFGGLQILSMVPLVGWVLFPFLFIIGMIGWLMGIYKAYNGETFELPVVGKMAKEQLKKLK